MATHRVTDAQARVEPASTEVDFENPEAYIARDRRRALSEGRELPDRAQGAAIFVDVSGFTAMTELLAAELGTHRGAEEVASYLDRVLEQLIAELDAYGGDTIYFAGDAITGWLDGDDGARAATCALAMQAVMARIGEFVTAAGSAGHLSIKVAIAVGSARRFVVGHPEIQLMDVLAGSLIDELAAAEQHANPGDVVLGPSALRSLGERVEVGARRTDDASGDIVGVLSRVHEPAAASVVDEPEQQLPEELVRPWLLPAVYERLRDGRGEFFAELRPAIPVMVRFGGIDYDEAEAAAKLDDFVRQVQRVLTGYGGNLLQLNLGDKGAYLYAVFGSPHIHEADAARAASAALELRALEAVTPAADIQIGITTGRLLSGACGHPMRRTFTCLGDPVNLAARLMSKAPPGGVFVTDALRQQAGDSFAWEQLSPMHVKGKRHPIDVYALTTATRPRSRRQRRYVDELVGRRAELAALVAAQQASLEGTSRVVGIAAEAGMGKSRLVAEFVRAVRAAGRLVAFGECPAFGAQANYAVWREVWRTLLDLDEHQPEDVQLATLRSRLQVFDPVLPLRAPLLGPLLGISIPESDVTRMLDPKLRKASLEDLLARCLKARAAEDPLVLVLEDCHWIDPLSRDLLEVLVRATPALPVLFVLNYRPGWAPGGELGLERLPHFSQLALTELEPVEVEQLLGSKLERDFGAGISVPPALVELVTTRTQGNPFYVEELLNYVLGEGVDIHDERALRELRAPESLHSLIMSRVDTLGESPRRTLKVASVIGRAFLARMLPGVYPQLGTHEEVRVDLGMLRAADLVTLDRPAEEAYIFKHVVTQEVTYDALPFATRAMLHGRTAAFIERTEADSLEHHVDLLAHHYWHSDNEPKKREFLVRAGEAAQGRYANEAAIDYYERAASLLTGPERIDVLLKLGKVRELTGDWSGAEEVAREALALADELGNDRAQAWCKTALAEAARRQGRYDEAASLLGAAAAAFEAAQEESGVGQIHHIAGTLAAQQGDYDRAVDRYEASLVIRDRLGDTANIGSLLSNLGVVAEYRGEYELSRKYHEEALAMREKLGDRWAIAVSMTNIGAIAVQQHDYAEARRRFELAMQLNREVGDAWSVAISENNLGNASRGLGDHEGARRHYAASLRAYRDYDDGWATAFLLEDVGQLAAAVAASELAFELVGAADTLREELGAPRPPACAEQLEAQLASCRAALGAEASAEARGRGRNCGSAQAFARALAFCGGTTV